MQPWHPFRSELAKQAYLAHHAQRAKDWPVPSEERTVPTSYGDTFVRVSGLEQGPSLVLLPGVGSPAHLLAPLAAPLAERYRLYAVDNIHDVGRSVNTRPVTGAADFVAWLDSLFDALQLPQVNLLGLSYGAWISAQYAVAHPGRVHRVVLLAPAGTVARLPFAFIWRGLLTLMSTRFMSGFADWAAPEMARSPEWAQRRAELLEAAIIGQSSFAPRRMVEPRPLSDAQWASLAPPTLVLAGDAEVMFDPVRAVERLKRVAPHVRTHLIPGASHDLFMVRAAEVSRRALDFLDPDRPA